MYHRIIGPFFSPSGGAPRVVVVVVGAEGNQGERFEMEERLNLPALSANAGTFLIAYSLIFLLHSRHNQKLVQTYTPT